MLYIEPHVDKHWRDDRSRRLYRPFLCRLARTPVSTRVQNDNFPWLDASDAQIPFPLHHQAVQLRTGRLVRAGEPIRPGGADDCRSDPFLQGNLQDARGHHLQTWWARLPQSVPARTSPSSERPPPLVLQQCLLDRQR